jgi:hypothetical protein
MRKNKMTAKQLDRHFDNGGSIEHLIVPGSETRPGLELKRINGDVPIWIVSELDKEAARIGITRLSVLKGWLAERAEALRKSAA